MRPEDDRFKGKHELEVDDDLWNFFGRSPERIRVALAERALKDPDLDPAAARHLREEIARDLEVVEAERRRA